MSQPGTSRVVVITGASRGLGRAMAVRFGRAGDRVVVNFLNNERAAGDVVSEIAESGGEAFPFRADVGRPGEIDALMTETGKRYGPVDVLINNAGLTRDGLVPRMTEENWDNVVRTNLTGAFLSLRAAARDMISRRRGHIVNISSIAGVQGREGQVNYSSAKAGLIGLTKASARELGCFNIAVNAVLPGYLITDMGAALSDVIHTRIVKENALGRVSDVVEAADFVYYLTLMRNVSGQVFNLDSRIL